MYTLYPPGLAVPVELGAEFVHGDPQITFDLLREAGTTRIERTGTQWERRGDTLTGGSDERFSIVDRLVERASTVKADISVDDFLARVRKEPALEEAARWFRLLVEGYDAADPRRAGIKEIAKEWSGPTFSASSRPLGGYGLLVTQLVRALDPRHVSLRFESVVEEIVWKSGSVTVCGRTHGEKFRIDARCAIVTLPVGVFSRVRFSPALDERKRKALGAIAMGPVVKVILRFRTSWWETLGDEFRGGAFFTDLDADFPSFWTQLPLHAPVLTGWAGGPRAARLAGQSREQLVRKALAALRGIFRPPHDITEEVEEAFAHDWDSDPFACGAYSYVLVGGGGARSELFVPMHSTLFFAGEATSEDESGTVSGALESGERAAKQALEVL